MPQVRPNETQQWSHSSVRFEVVMSELVSCDWDAMCRSCCGVHVAYNAVHLVIGLMWVAGAEL